MNRLLTAALIGLLCGTSPQILATTMKAPADLIQAIDDTQRSSQYRQRDRYRHPLETLAFFDVQKHMSVVEIWPGAGGWYSEILAPYLRQHGTFYAAQFNADSSAAFYRESRQTFIDKLQADPARYDRVTVTDFNPPTHTAIAPPNSADRVLTFRNVHNWYMRGGGDTRVRAAFQAMFNTLKPGGILGVVEHRLPAKRPLTDQEASGYMRQDYVIGMAQAVGFVLVGSSEINANAKDHANHPKGVWTLPPTLRLGENNRQHYLMIGESDRMTLKFAKPAQTGQ